MVRSDPKIQWVQPVLLVLSDPLPPKAPTDHSARSDPEARTVQSRHSLPLIQTVLSVRQVLTVLDPCRSSTRPSHRAVLSNLMVPLLPALRMLRLLLPDPPR